MTGAEIASIVAAGVALMGAATAWLRAEVANKRVTKHTTASASQPTKPAGS